MFAATFFWSRVKCFWEIWNCWNTREPTKLQPLGRPDNTIECSVGLRVSWLLIGVQICQVKDCRSWVVKALKLEHRCCRALFYFSLSLSLVWSIGVLLHFKLHHCTLVAVVFGRPCNLLLISPCPRLRPLRPAALERLGTNLSAQCYTNFGPVRWSDVVTEFQGIFFCRLQM